MHQFWYTIKKVSDTDSFEFLLDNKKCNVNAEVFRIVLDIFPRVEGVDFMDVPDDDIALTFLIDIGYKAPLNRHINMFMDHMHQPWGTLVVIINKCLSGKTTSNDKLRKSRIDILWGIIGKDYQEYGLLIPNVMLTDAIKCSKSYQMFIKCSTNQILPKKSIGKAKKKSASRRVVKKKVTLSADENIIFDDPDATLELAKSINQTEDEEAEAARKVHATHARIVTESVPESAKKKSSDRSAPFLTPAEQEATNIMQALKESKKTSRRQPGTGGSNEETGTILGVPDESTVISVTSSEGTGIKPGVPNKEKDIIDEKVILEWGDEQDSEHSDDDNDDVKKDDKDGDADDEGDDHYEDVEMKDAEVEGSDKGFGDQFLKLSSDSSLVSTVKDFADADVKTTNLPPIPETVTKNPVIAAGPSPQVTPIISTIQQTTSPIPTQPIITDAPIVTTTVPESNALTTVELRVAKLEKDMFELKTELQKHTADIIHKYSLHHLPELTKKPTLATEQESEKSPSKILKIKKEQAESQKNPQFTIKFTDKAALEEYDLKSALYQSMHANKSFNINSTNHHVTFALFMF
ncbi:hypothetical protein Tco_0651187 [Tanacetum coccineum]